MAAVKKNLIIINDKGVLQSTQLTLTDTANINNFITIAVKNYTQKAVKDGLLKVDESAWSEMSTATVDWQADVILFNSFCKNKNDKIKAIIYDYDRLVEY